MHVKGCAGCVGVSKLMHRYIKGCCTARYTRSHVSSEGRKLKAFRQKETFARNVKLTFEKRG